MGLGNHLKNIKLAYSVNKYKRATSDQAKKLAAKTIAQTLGERKGVFLKLGQIMGSSSDAIEEFESLCTGDLEFMPMDEVKDIISNRYETSWESLFTQIDQEAHPASIGQVHKAKLKMGQEEVAIKIQYPSIKEEIDQQLGLLHLGKVVGNIGPLKKWNIPIEEYQKALESDLEEEVDYFHEIKNHKRYAQHKSHQAHIVTAKIFDDLSRKDIYVQSWEEGIFLNTLAKTWSPQEKIKLGEILFSNFIQDFIQHGFVQGDTNHGNYLFRKNQTSQIEVVCLDFGNCFEIPKEFRLSFLKLFFVVTNQEDVDPLDLLCLMGFDDKKLMHLHQQIPQLVNIILTPFTSQYPYHLKNWNLKESVDKCLGEYKWWFRSAGSILFFKLMKSFLGVMQQIETLDVALNFRDIFLKETVHLTPELMGLNIPSHSQNKIFQSMLAKNLNLIVFRNGAQTVNLMLPSTAINQLSEVMDGDILQKCEERNINIDEIVKNVLKSGGGRQVLFNLVEENLSVTVQLV
jgi:predicted unusual protein kinase regulating ubiquinone biosynthesis (AarF/ABC1/UbiB family)